MASLIEGYEYDIFISYRQKDNKHDGWVTEFASYLKGELESAFKEEVSVYFDINPHDGLLETHDVEESLKNKLKCLVFIPIISRTYCDPKSFAWEHEFKAFVDQASKDQFGLKVKLPNGNVASRVLPVSIYDLDPVDVKLCESLLEGPLRGVEFIYAEPGVNRPLKPDDDEKINLNKTKYRNQTNKVGNAIKDVITAIRLYNPQKEEVSQGIHKPVSEPRKNYIKIITTGLVIILAIVILGIFLIPKLVNPSVQIEKSIAVLPFKNDSPNDSTTYFINGIMEDILTNLQTIKDLRVIYLTSVEEYRNPTKSIAEIAKELNVNFIVAGSGQKYGNTIKLRVRLIMAAKESQLWAKPYEQEIKDAKDIFKIQSQIAQAIAAELKAVITPQEKQIIEKTPTENIEAYNAYQMGRFYWRKLTPNDLNTALKYFELAKEKDADYALAYAGICYYWLGAQQMGIVSAAEAGPKAETAAKKALELDSTSAEVHYSLAIMKYEVLWDWEGGESEFKKTLELNPNDAEAHAYYSHLLNIVGRSEEAMKQIEVALKLDPRNPLIKSLYGVDLLFVHKYDEAIIAFQEALKGDPTAPVALSNLPNALHFAGRDIEALELLRMKATIPEIKEAFSNAIATEDFAGARRNVGDILVEKSKTTYINPIRMASNYAFAGDKNKAIDWLEKAYQEHEPNLPYLLSPNYDSLRDDPRFQYLCRRMNLPYK